jgi:hypothetical protein
MSNSLWFEVYYIYQCIESKYDLFICSIHVTYVSSPSVYLIFLHFNFTHIK